MSAVYVQSWIVPIRQAALDARARAENLFREICHIQVDQKITVLFHWASPSAVPDAYEVIVFLKSRSDQTTYIVKECLSL